MAAILRSEGYDALAANAALNQPACSIAIAR